MKTIIVKNNSGFDLGLDSPLGFNLKTGAQYTLSDKFTDTEICRCDNLVNKLETNYSATTGFCINDGTSDLSQTEALNYISPYYIKERLVIKPETTLPADPVDGEFCNHSGTLKQWDGSIWKVVSYV